MTAFDHLERELRYGVRRAHGSAQSFWRRSPVLGLAAALTVTAGALAATGTIRIGDTHDEPGSLKPQRRVFAGVRASRAQTLPLRVADPAGGAPWTLRVFDSSRGGHCVQLGQVVRGHFGVFVPPGTLEPLRAWPGGESSLCSGQARGGFPVVRGLQRIRVVGGMGDRHRCPSRPHGDCPITSVTMLRYGLLGPGARRVRLVDAQGSTLAAIHTSPSIGGAYLFAIPQATAPYVTSERRQRAQQDAMERAMKAARARGLSPRQALNEALRHVRGRLRGQGVRPSDVSILATFADGRTLRVAGRHRSHAALPGLGTENATKQVPLPRDLPVRVRVQRPGRFAVVTVTFVAPRAIKRFDVHYTATLRGRTGTGCDDSIGGYHATTRDIEAGETVRFTLKRPRGAFENGREGWCSGRFTGEIRYSTPGRHVVIGHYAFTIP